MNNLKADELTFVIYFAWSLLHLTSRVGSAWIKTHWLLSLFTASDEVQHSYNLNWGAIDLFTTPNEVQYSFQQGAIVCRCVFKRHSMYHIEFTPWTLKAEKLHAIRLHIYQRQKRLCGYRSIYWNIIYTTFSKFLTQMLKSSSFLLASMLLGPSCTPKKSNNI